MSVRDLYSTISPTEYDSASFVMTKDPVGMVGSILPLATTVIVRPANAGDWPSDVEYIHFTVNTKLIPAKAIKSMAGNLHITLINR